CSSDLGRDRSRFAARAQLQVVLAARPTALATLLGVVPTAGLHLVDHLVEVVAGVFTELFAHLAHPARHSLRVVLVEVAQRRGIAEIVQPVIFGANQGEPGHQAREPAAAAPLALGLDLLTHSKRQHGGLSATIGAAVLVDRHDAAIIARGDYCTTPGATRRSRPRLRRGRATGSGGIGGAQGAAQPRPSTGRAPGIISPPWPRTRVRRRSGTSACHSPRSR